MRIKVIKDKNQLTGTGYIEYQIGEHKNEFWENDSIYLEDEAQSFLHTFIYDALPNYDIAGFTSMDYNQCEHLIKLLTIFCNRILDAESIEEIKKISLPEKYPNNYFDDFFKNGIDSFKDDFKIFFEEIKSWLIKSFQKNNKVTILGL